MLVLNGNIVVDNNIRYVLKTIGSSQGLQDRTNYLRTIQNIPSLSLKMILYLESDDHKNPILLPRNTKLNFLNSDYINNCYVWFLFNLYKSKCTLDNLLIMPQKQKKPL